MPLHTLRADIDYGFAEAHTTYGIIGIKTWIYKGEILGDRPRRQVSVAILSRAVRARDRRGDRRRRGDRGDRRGPRPAVALEIVVRVRVGGDRGGYQAWPRRWGSQRRRSRHASAAAAATESAARTGGGTDSAAAS